MGKATAASRIEAFKRAGESNARELDKHMPPKHEIEVYIEALRELQKEAVVEGQEKVRQEAIRVLLMVFKQWPRRCTCPRTRAKSNGKVQGVTRLCQACKRMNIAWRVYVQLEKLAVVRAQQGARIIEHHQKRAVPGGEHEAVGVFAAFHRSKPSPEITDADIDEAVPGQFSVDNAPDTE